MPPSAQHEFEQFYPQAGWVEHDPTEILTSQLSCAVEALVKDRRAAARRGGHRHYQPARNDDCVGPRDGEGRFIPRLCGRTGALRRSARNSKRAGWGRQYRRRPGWCWIRIFPATKVKWILDNVPGARARAERGELAFGTVDSWLIWHLTSGQKHVTDVTNASRTLLFNIVKGEWDESC